MLIPPVHILLLYKDLLKFPTVTSYILGFEMFTKAFVLFVVGVCFANAAKTGGQFAVSSDDQEIRGLLQKALDAENERTKSEPHAVVDVLKVVGKVVAGRIYTVTYVSQGIYSGTRVQCEIELYDRQWVSDTPKVLSNKCVPATTLYAY